jgi:putative intracellular protease/amidase
LPASSPENQWSATDDRRQRADEKVVEDKNLVSSRQPSDLPEFIAASLAMLK